MEKILNARVINSLTSEQVCICEINLDDSTTVFDLKRQIQEASGISVDEQRLVLGKRVMRNGSCLEDLFTDGDAENVDISLLRSNPGDDPQKRQRAFAIQFLQMSHGTERNRWDFHHSGASQETDLNRGWADAGQLFIKIHQDSKHTATFSLCSLDFPLRELFDTFAEQAGLPIVELQFFFQGRCLLREDTPHLCGMEPCSLEDAHIIDVEYADGQRRRQHLFRILNQMGEVVRLAPRSLGTLEAQILDADSVTRGLAYLGLSDLVNTTVVSTFWFHATQRLSLLLQLRHGDLALATATPQEYKDWLISVFGHSKQLALAEAERQAQLRHKEAELWQSLHVSKEKPARSDLDYQGTATVYAFCKAAGCTSMKTVSLQGLAAEFEQQWLSLYSCKSKFMALCQEHSIEKGDSEKWLKPTRSNGSLKSVLEKLGEKMFAGDGSTGGLKQELPPYGSSYFTADAVDPALQAVAVELFRRYFSPDMYFIFPLMVGRESAFGLDFTSTTTTLFFGPKAYVGSPLPAPAGACSWRLHQPLQLEPAMRVIGETDTPQPLLEVLFIAVWEEERDQVHGGALVSDLEARARGAGVSMLYVEIGFEQPKARRFWRKQGFGKVVKRESSELQMQQFADAEEHEDVPMPLIPLSQTQLSFFESNCLRFADTAQYVKVLS